MFDLTHDRYPSTDGWAPPAGRHALDEDALLTPIFHSLVRGARRPGDGAAHRDTPTAPMPVLRLPPPAPLAHRRRRAVDEGAVEDTGRHHRRSA